MDSFNRNATRKTTPKESADNPMVAAALLGVGERIRQARVARDWTLSEMSVRIGVQAKTLGRLERGAPGVSIETLALVLWHMNLLEHLDSLALPQNDPEGQRLALLRAPRRARGGSRLGSSGWEDLDKL